MIAGSPCGLPMGRTGCGARKHCVCLGLPFPTIFGIKMAI